MKRKRQMRNRSLRNNDVGRFLRSARSLLNRWISSSVSSLLVVSSIAMTQIQRTRSLQTIDLTETDFVRVSDYFFFRLFDDACTRLTSSAVYSVRSVAVSVTLDATATQTGREGAKAQTYRSSSFLSVTSRRDLGFEQRIDLRQSLESRKRG